MGIDDFKAFLILWFSEEQLIITIAKSMKDKIKNNRFIIAGSHQDRFFAKVRIILETAKMHHSLF